MHMDINFKFFTNYFSFLFVIFTGSSFLWLFNKIKTKQKIVRIQILFTLYLEKKKTHKATTLNTIKNSHN